jgi:hypothetical protein
METLARINPVSYVIVGAPPGLASAPCAPISLAEVLGSWPHRSSFRSIFGTIDLDLREARLAGPEVEIDIFNFFGTVTLIVPEGIAVIVEGGGLFASQVIDPPASAVPDEPKLRIGLSGPGGTL